MLDNKAIVDLVQENKEKMAIKVPSPKTAIRSLSGGNQQKVLIARWLANNPDVLILDEPTRGIDVGAKYEIYCIIADLAKAGQEHHHDLFRNERAHRYVRPGDGHV